MIKKSLFILVCGVFATATFAASPFKFVPTKGLPAEVPPGAPQPGLVYTLTNTDEDAEPYYLEMGANIPEVNITSNTCKVNEWGFLGPKASCSITFTFTAPKTDEYYDKFIADVAGRFNTTVPLELKTKIGNPTPPKPGPGPGPAPGPSPQGATEIKIMGDIDSIKPNIPVQLQMGLNGKPTGQVYSATITADGQFHTFAKLPLNTDGKGNPISTEYLLVSSDTYQDYKLRSKGPFWLDGSSANPKINLEFNKMIPTTVKITGLPVGTSVPVDLVGDHENTQTITADGNAHPFTPLMQHNVYNINPSRIKVGDTEYALVSNSIFPISATNTQINMQYAAVTPATAPAGTINYHVTFPTTSSTTTDSLTYSVANNYDDLILSNLVAGTLYVHMLREHNPTLLSTSTGAPDYSLWDYDVGTLYGQLLQENMGTSDPKNKPGYVNTSSDINPMINYDILLGIGEGGPYQLNNYSVPMVNSVGLINYVTLQKGLAYPVAYETDNTQTTRPGPGSLDNKYFGPIAAAYFHYDDYLLSQTKSPSMTDWKSCDNSPAEQSILDMIQNADYNAGINSPIYSAYVKHCADNDLSKMDDESADPDQYNQEIGMKSGGTFVLYPRQIRYYIHQLEHLNGQQTNLSIPFNMGMVEMAFVNAMQTMAYQNGSTYDFIPYQNAKDAFDSAMQANGVTPTTSLALGNATDRQQVYKVIDMAISNLETKLNFKFTDTTQKDL